MAGQRAGVWRAAGSRRRGRRRGSRCRETAPRARAAHRAAPPCPCVVRRIGPGTAPSCRGADSPRAASPTRTTRRRHRWGSRRRRCPSASICQRRARSDTAMRPTIFSCIGRRNGFEHRQCQRFRRRGVKGRDDRARGDVQRQHRQAGGVRFVQVQHVEVALLQPFLDLAVGGRTEAQPGHRPVVGNRDGLAARDYVVGQGDVRLRPRRREHADLVAVAAHHVGELQHV